MTDIVTTTGRPMTPALQHALDDLPDRDLTIEALRASTGRLRALHAALALELELVELRESTILTDLATDLAPTDPEPLPRAEGVDWFPDEAA